MTINYNNKEYNVNIIKKNNKNIYIKVKDGEVIVTCNRFTLKSTIEKLIKDNYSAITKMIDKMEKKEEKSSKFYLFGKNYNIIYDNTSDFKIVDNTIYVKDIETQEKYLNVLIKKVFSDRMEHWKERYKEKIPNPNLKIRKMKTRWGVCNISNNNVTLNKELYRYDLDCLDYVIIHELSHFIHANHSKSFWNQVSKYCPNYKEIRNKLKE